MIQALRTSRKTSLTQKSESDLKIDDIMQQVRKHAEEWINEVLF